MKFRESHGLANRQVASEGHRFERQRDRDRMGSNCKHMSYYVTHTYVYIYIYIYNHIHIYYVNSAHAHVPNCAYIFRYQHTSSHDISWQHIHTRAYWGDCHEGSGSKHLMSNILNCASGSGRRRILGLWAQSHVRNQRICNSHTLAIQHDLSRSFRNTRPQHRSWTQSSEIHLSNRNI
jgi:hypothetical protein